MNATVTLSGITLSGIGASRISQWARAAAVAGTCFFMSFTTAQSAEQEVIGITTKAGKQHAFSVELAITDAEKQRGLMFRRSVPEFTGMLFDFKDERERQMWMKNTYVSLDMIFIQSDGRIRSIAENTQTESEKVISSGGPVRAVLEVVAGTARKLGIAPGDRVESATLQR
jgi:uncharacterized protein